MRLDQFLTILGVGSRKQVKRLIVRKQVRIDGRIILADDYNVEPKIQLVSVAGKIITKTCHTYYMLHKPAGVVTTSQEKNQRTVFDLLAAADQREGLYPVGRLDKSTEGLLLLTDNGQLGYQLLLPEYHIAKTYEVVVNGKITEGDQRAFFKGIVFPDGTKCKSADLEIVRAAANESQAVVTIYEGKFHQIKKMFLCVGKKVTDLKRIRMGPLVLDPKLAVGHYRELTQDELLRFKPYFNCKK